MGLHLRLVLAAAMTIFLSVACVSGLLVYRQTKVLREEIQRSSAQLRAAMIERGDLLAENVGANMENAIAGFNFAFVTAAMETIQEKNRDLAYGLVTNATGIITAVARTLSAR